MERVKCLERAVVQLRIRAERSEAQAATAFKAAAAEAAAAERAEAKVDSMQNSMQSHLGTSSAKELKVTATAAAAMEQQGGGGLDEQRGKKRGRPPVPTFNEPEEYIEVLPRAPLSPPRPEENYEISDTGECSDEESMMMMKSASFDRSHKHVPEWCERYLEALSEQASVDPDCIFGPRVPACKLAEVFPDRLYEHGGQSPPKRRRGSSGNWGKDKLTSDEIRDYKCRMGQTRRRWIKDGQRHVLVGSGVSSASGRLG
jgi:hypothetical protein